MPSTHLPWCLSGAYAPCVLACGFFASSQEGQPLDLANLPNTHYRLLCVESGSVRLRDERITVATGGYLLLPPGHTVVLRLGRGGRLSHLLFDVTPSPRELRGGRLVALDAPPQPGPREVWGVDLPLVVPSDLNHQIIDHWLQIRARYWRRLPNQLRANVLLAGLLAEMVAWVMGGTENSDDEDNDPAIRRALRIGSEPSDRRLTCADLARTARLSRSRFCQRFHAREGVTPRVWLLNGRLQQAAHLLRTTRAAQSSIQS